MPMCTLEIDFLTLLQFRARLQCRSLICLCQSSPLFFVAQETESTPASLTSFVCQVIVQEVIIIILTWQTESHARQTNEYASVTFLGIARQFAQQSSTSSLAVIK